MCRAGALLLASEEYTQFISLRKHSRQSEDISSVGRGSESCVLRTSTREALSRCVFSLCFSGTLDQPPAIFCEQRTAAGRGMATDILSGLDGEKLDVAFLTSAVENLEGSSCAAVTAAEVVDGTENK